MADSTLFIPDISGFTRFVNSTEINHSAHIIEELINLIVEEGSKSFEIAEIEGDAVFFFKQDQKMTPSELQEEARRIFIAFHKHTSLYEHKRICNCGACTSAVDLKLKFVVHAGEIGFANFTGGKAKPFGSPVIAVHRLLKNDVDLDEYVLFSEDFIGDSELKADGNSSFSDPDLGEVEYQYVDVDSWKEDLVIEEEEFAPPKINMTVEVVRVIDHEADLLHNYISDFRYRHLWNKGADKIIYDEKEINQVGTEHYCVINGKNLFFDTIRPGVQPNQKAYGEILKNPAPLKYLESSFIMTPVGAGQTELKICMRASVKWAWQRILLPIIRKKFERQGEYILGEISSTIDQSIPQLTEVPVTS